MNTVRDTTKSERGEREREMKENTGEVKDATRRKGG